MRHLFSPQQRQYQLQPAEIGIVKINDDTIRSSRPTNHHHRSKWRRHRRLFFCRGNTLSVLLLLLISNIVTILLVAASHQQQQRRTILSSFSHRTPKYDRSVTTFDPHGQLLQVQYAQYAANQRTKRTIIAMIDYINNNIYIATTTSTHGDDEPYVSQQPHQFVYQITKETYFVGIGLMGDIRAMASHIRVQAQQYIYQYDEQMSVHQMAQLICQLQHQCTYQSGIRPLGMTCLIFGIDESNNDDARVDDSTPHNTWKLYKCTPGGSIPEDCGGTIMATDGECDNFSCTVVGYQAETILKHVYDYEDVPSEPFNSTDVDTTNTTTTSTSMDEADCMIHFISAIRSALVQIDGTNSDNNGIDRETSQTTDVYVFRTRHDKPHRPAVSCFANINCGSNNNAYQKSLQRVRQYYDQQ